MIIRGDRDHPALAEYDKARSWLCEAMAPDVWGTLTYYREDGPVSIRCRAVALPTISAPVGTFSTIDVDLIADTPYWERAEEQVTSVGRILRLLHFPWAPKKGPWGCFNRFAGISNDTTRQIFPTVEIFATGQHVTLENVTAGKSVTIEHGIAENEKLVVDLRDVTAILWRRDASGAYQEAEDVSHWMSLTSEPWALVPGWNHVVISNENPEDTPLAYLRYRLPVLGV